MEGDGKETHAKKRAEEQEMREKHELLVKMVSLSISLCTVLGTILFSGLVHFLNFTKKQNIDFLN
jgi:hypothetical protein